MRDTIRLDKWLWYARFFKTRTLAAKKVTDGGVRVNSEKVAKAAMKVGAGDTLTFGQERTVRVVEILACGVRRGPASEAQTLYLDKTPPTAKTQQSMADRRVGKRPTKKDRRILERSRMTDLD